MADRLRKLVASLAAELEKQLGTKWQIYDSATDGDPPLAHLGHGGDQGERMLWIFTTRPFDRGLVIRSAAGRLDWQIDDGRGLIEAGTARRPAELLDRVWHPLLEHLVDPGDVLMQIMRQAMAAPPFNTMSAPLRTLDTISWGGWRHPSVHATVTSTGAGSRFPYIEHYDGRQLFIYLRELTSTADLARRMAAVILDYVTRLIADGHQGSCERRHDGPTFAGFDQVRLEHRFDWRPDAPPASLRDASATRRETTLDGGWSERLDELLDEEDPAQRAQRVARAQERLAAGVHLPDRDDAGIDTKVKKGWGYGEGAERIAFDLRTIAALYLLGLGARLASRVLVGDERAKNAVHRRMKECRDGGARWASVDGAWLLEQLGLDEHARPADESGGAPGRADGPAEEPEHVEAPEPGPKWAETLRLHEQTDAVRVFLENLPERSVEFCALLAAARPDPVSITAAMHALDLVVPKAMSGIVNSIPRWAPIRRLPTPFKTGLIDGERVWWWVGFGPDDPTSATVIPPPTYGAGATPAGVRITRRQGSAADRARAELAMEGM